MRARGPPGQCEAVWRRLRSRCWWRVGWVRARGPQGRCEAVWRRLRYRCVVPGQLGGQTGRATGAAGSVPGRFGCPGQAPGSVRPVSRHGSMNWSRTTLPRPAGYVTRVAPANTPRQGPPDRMRAWVYARSSAGRLPRGPPRYRHSRPTRAPPAAPAAARRANPSDAVRRPSGTRSHRTPASAAPAVPTSGHAPARRCPAAPRPGASGSAGGEAGRAARSAAVSGNPHGLRPVHRRDPPHPPPRDLLKDLLHDLLRGLPYGGDGLQRREPPSAPRDARP